MIKHLILAFCFMLIVNKALATDFWQPYPINAEVVTLNGTDFKVDFSVYDSLTATWMYYSTPFYNCGGILISDSINSVIGFNVMEYNNNNVLIREGVFGFVIYDMESHLFKPVFSQYQSNPNTSTPGAFLTANNASIIISGYSDWGSAFGIFDYNIIYDIVKHAWDTVGYINGNYYAMSFGLSNYGGGFCVGHDFHSSSDDNYIVTYYDPVLQRPIQNWSSFVGSFQATGPDIIYSGHNGVYDSNAGFYSYSPKTHTWAGGKGASGTSYVQLRKGMIQFNKYSGIFDDSLNMTRIDSSTIAATIMKDGIIVYVSGNTVNYKAFSPSQRTWITSSTTSASPTNVSIQNGTVHWLDLNGISYQAGYNDSIGWGTFDTPLQLSFEVTHAYNQTGLPYVFVRNYSIGTDSICYDFGDGVVSDYNQHSLWHLYKVNGHYQSTSSPVNYDICIKTVNDSGPQTYCKSFQITCLLPSVPVITSTTTTICQNESIVLTINGNLNDAANWVWYESGCGTGNPVGTGDTLTLFPNQSTTYYARGEGGCVTNTACSDISIVVNQLAPHVITHTGNLSFCLGDSVELNSIINFPSYQWYHYNTILTGEVNSTYFAKSAGNYYCVGNDLVGCQNESNTLRVRIPCIPLGPVNERVATDLNNIIIYPNPSDGSFDLFSPLGYLKIYNTNGQIVYEENLIQTNTKLNLLNLSGGLYRANILSGSENYMQTFIIK